MRGMATTSPVRYRFGTFELQPEERRLLAGGAPVTLGRRAFDLLVTLVERDGRLTTKDELLERVWPRVVVEANALQSQISALRKVLGAEAIATVAGSGYRFTLRVVQVAAEQRRESLPKHNLPQPVTSFIGRDKEIAQIGLLLTRTRLLTLTGAGGCGKTRLAIQAAQGLVESYPDGIWFIELAAHADPGLVPNTVATALGLGEQRGQTVAQSIASHVSTSRPLIVLDNAEHLVVAVTALVDELLTRCERVIFLITSRQQLGLAGELAFRVPSLSVPDPKRDATPQRLAGFESVQLFVDRAQLQRPHFAVTAEVAPVLASICHQLEGIPLAIELAAPRLRSMSIEEVNRRLDQRFGLLTSGSRTTSHRQRTLRATIDWSYDLLSEAEQALLCRASVFAGGWTLEAAERVCIAEGDEATGTLELLASLADKSLVVAEEHDGVSRYRMLETVRQYARERLKEEGVGRQWQNRHLSYFLAIAEEIAPRLKDADPRPWLDRLETEHDNMRAAMEWCSGAGADPNRGLRLANSLWRFWMLRGHLGEGLAALVRSLELTRGSGSPADRATALNAAGSLAFLRSDLNDSQSFLEESLAIRRRLGDLKDIAQSLGGLGNTAQRRGGHSAARAFYQESIEISRRLGDKRAVAILLNNLATIADDLGEYAEARVLHEESLSIREELCDRAGIASSLLNLAAVAQNQGEYLEAKGKCEESLAVHQELGDPRGVAWCLVQLGIFANDRGDFAAAEEFFRACLPRLVDLGDQWAMTFALDGFANACATTQGSRAACLWGATERLREASGTPHHRMGRAHEERDVAVARTSFGDDASFDRAWQHGRTMNLQQAVDFALGVEAESGPPS